MNGPTDILPADQADNATSKQLSPFSSDAALDGAMRAAKALASSSIVPKEFQGANNIGNVLIALELSQRLGVTPMAVMQGLHVIHGKPSFSSQFMISIINSCGRFSPLRFDVSGEGDQRQCIAYANDLETGERIDGPPVSIAMAKAEGWFQKNGSKWKTMPELMLRYRAATFFARLYAPDLIAGFMTSEELADIRRRNSRNRAQELMQTLREEQR